MSRVALTLPVALAVVLVALLASAPSVAQSPAQATDTPAAIVYAPLILKNPPPPPTPTPTATATTTDMPTATATATDTATPTPSHTPTATATATDTATPTLTPTPTLSPTPSPTPTNTPVLPMFGIWQGPTSQAKTVGFTIKSDRSRVCGISFDYRSPDGSNCFIGGPLGNARDCPAISPDGRFTWEYSSSALGVSFTNRVDGVFTSATTASGTLRHVEPFRNCDANATWTASLTNLPTPTPRVCPAVRPGQWDGAASFTVSADRSRVVNFSMDLPSFCGGIRVTVPELPITECEIVFRASNGDLSVGGSGAFTSDTEISGSFGGSSSTCFGSGTWNSQWVSAGP